MADLDELLSEGLISPRALDRLKSIYGGSPIAPGSADADAMTHWPPGPNTALPVINAAKAFATGGLHDLAQQQGMQPPAWSDRVADFLHKPEINAALGVITPLRTPIPPRLLGIPSVADPPIFSYRNTSSIRAHPDYAAAKAGDSEAAARFVLDTARPETIEAARQQFGPDVSYVPVHAEEQAGRNKIPGVLAQHYADETGATVADNIVQSSRAYHTGADAMSRLIARPTFQGPVEAGRRYVLVDDVGVLGNTLAELANHIRGNGGEVAGVVTLVHRSPTPYYAADPNDINQLVARHGQAIQEHFGIEPGALTAQEAKYLLQFGSPDTLRGRVAEARSARDASLRQGSVAPPEGGEGP